MGLKRVTIESDGNNFTFDYENITCYHDLYVLLQSCKKDARMKLSKGIPLSNSVSPTEERAQD